MNKVITINLNGRAYSLEETGYDALRKYLDQAAAKLEGNPDKDEIMADFEFAVAAKCDARLSSRKNVVTTAEIEEIIKTMGPVDTGAKETAAGDAAASENASHAYPGPKRLYQVRQGAWITGVCNGLAAYFNLDVALIRVLFVLVSFLTHGFGIALYIILMIVIPVARTDEEKAWAHGVAPFNASDFIEQAKSRYAEFQKMHQHPPHPAHPKDHHDKEAWKKWKEDMKEWKRQLKHDMREHKNDWADRFKEGTQYAWHNSPVVAAGTGFFRFLIGLVITAITVLWIIAIVTLVRHGTILGYAVTTGPLAHPLWLGIVFLGALYYVIVLPFKLLMKNARPWRWKHYSFFNDVVQSIFFVFAIYLVIYIGREFFPVVNEAWSMVVTYLRSVIH
jgi:phage shock protein PspC (stress-responsive transcriptional regulator)